MFEKKKVGAVVAGLGDHGSRVDRIILKPDAVGGHIKPDDTLPGDTHTPFNTHYRTWTDQADWLSSKPEF